MTEKEEDRRRGRKEGKGQEKMGKEGKRWRWEVTEREGERESASGNC